MTGVVTIISKSQNNRLKALEDVLRRDRITVIARLPDGCEQSMTVSEMLERDAAFCRVLAGSDIQDFDVILDGIASQSVIERDEVYL